MGRRRGEWQHLSDLLASSDSSAKLQAAQVLRPPHEQEERQQANVTAAQSAGVSLLHAQAIIAHPAHPANGALLLASTHSRAHLHFSSGTPAARLLTQGSHATYSYTSELRIVPHLHFSGGTPATQFLKKSLWYDSASAGCCIQSRRHPRSGLHTERELRPCLLNILDPASLLPHRATAAQCSC